MRKDSARIPYIVSLTIRIDDSLFDRSRSGKTELLAKIFDHYLLSAADDKNLLCDAADFDGRSLAGKRRKKDWLAITSA